MSIKESQSRVQNKKQYDKNLDNIFKNKQKSKAKRVEEATNELYGKVTRYYFTDKIEKPENEFPSITYAKSRVEKSLEN